MEIILSEESGWVDLQQAVGRLINAIVAVTGPELAPGSIFFSRCKVKVMPIVFLVSISNILTLWMLNKFMFLCDVYRLLETSTVRIQI